jgi:hypothetical protein
MAKNRMLTSIEGCFLSTGLLAAVQIISVDLQKLSTQTVLGVSTAQRESSRQMGSIYEFFRGVIEQFQSDAGNSVKCALRD